MEWIVSNLPVTFRPSNESLHDLIKVLNSNFMNGVVDIKKGYLLLNI